MLVLEGFIVIYGASERGFQYVSECFDEVVNYLSNLWWEVKRLLNNRLHIVVSRGLP